MKLLDLEIKRHYQEQFNLSYQLDFLSLINHTHNLQGKKVIEIGGSNLPRSLVLGIFKAEQWICVDEINPEQARFSEKNYSLEGITSLKESSRALDTEYAIISGDINELDIKEHFDVAISIAAFEHIHKIGGMLEHIHNCLKPESALLSAFDPIWPSINGHHIWGIKDNTGREYNFTSGLVPPWGHLLLTPPQMRRYLLSKVDAKCADEVIYYIYHSTEINRLFIEDYIDYLTSSPFKENYLQTFNIIQVPPNTQSELERLHPGKKRFDSSGVLTYSKKK